MGWWQTFDGTVIGDELADIVDDNFDKLVCELLERYPTITREQVLHTIAFCSGYLRPFDDGGGRTNNDMILIPMTITQMRAWRNRHKVEQDMSIRVAPDTRLENVFNPFTGAIV